MFAFAIRTIMLPHFTIHTLKTYYRHRRCTKIVCQIYRFISTWFGIFLVCEANNKIHSQLLGCRVIYLNNFTGAHYSAHGHGHDQLCHSVVWVGFFVRLPFFSVMLHLSKQYIFCAMSMHVGKISCVPLIYGAETLKDTHEYTYRVGERAAKKRSAQTFPYPYFSHISICTIFISFIYTFSICVCVFACLCARERVAVLLPLQISCVSQSINTYTHIYVSLSRSLSFPFRSMSKWWHWRVQLSVKNLLYKWRISLDIDAFECSSVSTYLRHSLAHCRYIFGGCEWMSVLSLHRQCLCVLFLFMLFGLIYW